MKSIFIVKWDPLLCSCHMLSFFLFFPLSVEQCMPEIKVLTSIFSFDYKHMARALKLTPVWDARSRTQLTLFPESAF